MTKYGKEILALIESSRDHLTASQVYHTIKEVYPNIALATVYNNLNSLCEQGKIRRLSIENEVDRFDRIENHGHLICRKCGKITDVYMKDMKKRFEKETGVSLESYDLKLFYICPDCK